MKHKILVVEDDPLLRLVLRMHLEESNYEVFDCENGVKAKDIVSNLIPDAVIVDYMMPEMDGISFLKWLKNQKLYEDVPMFLLTALFEGDIMQYKADGLVSEIYQKPVEGKTIIQSLRNTLHEA